MKKNNKSGAYIDKWLKILVVFLIIGGVFSFGLLAYLANVIEGTESFYNPVWMVGMIPLMIIIATPVSLLINKLIRKHIDVLTRGINEVANGNLDTYIKTADAGAFSDVYQDFNRMTAEIQSIQILKNEMMDSFSHELKTPVASINGFVKLLLEEELPKEKQDKYLSIILKESERLLQLTKNTLTMSKIDSQEIITDKKVYNLGKQLEECAISLENEWSTKNIDLSADIDNIMFEGDANLMESVWLNLIGNAIKFTPKNGEINIKTEKVEDKICVTISDTGIGMSKENIEHIFEKHFQTDKTHAANGYGLGLPIVQKILKLCNGSVKVESKEGEGSKFIVTLPSAN